MADFGAVIVSLLAVGIAQATEQAQAWNGPIFQQKVHFIDVGQGDSILIQFPNDQTILIDAGTKSAGNTVVYYLKQQGVNKIDYLVATHPHEDHIGGMIAVVNEFDINKVYMPKVTHTTQTYENLLLAIQNKGLKITPAEAGTAVLDQDDLNVDFVAPVGADYDNLNN